MNEKPRKKQSGVIVSAVHSSQIQSPPPLPALSSGSSSPSISAVDTESASSNSSGGRGASSRASGNHEHGIVSVITSPSSSGEDVAVASRSSSWDTAAPSSSSMARSLAVSVPGSESGVQSESRMYICLFHMLDCYDSFDDAELWRTHVLSHFRTHPPPSSARCPLCPDIKFVDGGSEPDIATNNDNNLTQPDSPETDSPSPTTDTAWNLMLNHVATTHYQQGQTLAGSRPDFELMRYLYGLRIITDAQFKAMQLAPAPSSPAYHRSQDGVRASIGSSDEPYCAPYSRRREERMRGQVRGVSVV